MSYKPWQEAYLLNSANCGRDNDLNYGRLQEAQLTLKANTGTGGRAAVRGNIGLDIRTERI